MTSFTPPALQDSESDNLCRQCHSFMEIESTEHGVPGIVTMLKSSTTDDKSVRDYDFLLEAAGVGLSNYY
jgi:hypothetical protein